MRTTKNNMEENKTYYVTYGLFYYGRYQLNSTEVNVYVKPDISQGQLAQELENMLCHTLDDSTIVIINFWEM